MKQIILFCLGILLLSTLPLLAEPDLNAPISIQDLTKQINKTTDYALVKDRFLSGIPLLKQPVITSTFSDERDFIYSACRPKLSEDKLLVDAVFNCLTVLKEKYAADPSTLVDIWQLEAHIYTVYLGNYIKGIEAAEQAEKLMIQVRTALAIRSQRTWNDLANYYRLASNPDNDDVMKAKAVDCYKKVLRLDIYDGYDSSNKELKAGYIHAVTGLILLTPTAQIEKLSFYPLAANAAMEIISYRKGARYNPEFPSDTYFNTILLSWIDETIQRQPKNQLLIQQLQGVKAYVIQERKKRLIDPNDQDHTLKQ